MLALHILAGSVGIGCVRLLARLGIRSENLVIYDVTGPLSAERGPR